MSHPALLLPETKNIEYNVLVINEKDEVEDYKLHVASCGVFFIKVNHPEKRIIISYFFIHELKINEFYTTIRYKCDQKIVFTSRKFLEISHKIAENHNALFKDQNLKIEFENPEIKEAFNKFEYKCNSNFLTYNRYISLSLDIMDNESNGEILNKDYFDFQDTFVVKNEKECPLALIAISYNESVTKVEFTGLNVSEINESFFSFLETDKNIKRVKFTNCNFDKNPDSNIGENRFRKVLINELCSIKEIILDNCNLEQFDLFRDRENYSIIKNHFSTLIIKNCTFTDETFNALYNSLVRSASLHSLSLFYFEGKTPETFNDSFQEVLRLPSFSNALCLRNNNNIDFGQHFTRLNKLLPPILDLSSNKISKFPTDFAKLLCKKQKLIFKNCIFENNAMTEMLEGLKSFNGLLELDITNNSKFKDFIDSKEKIPSLVGLIIDENIINNLEELKIAKYENIEYLSISDCITEEKFYQEILKKIINELTNLKKLRITSSNSQTILGSRLYKALKVLHSPIEDLNITGQGIEDEKIEKLISKFPQSMKYFAFDNDGEKIKKALYEKGIKRVEWPLPEDSFIDEYISEYNEYKKEGLPSEEENKLETDDNEMQFWYPDEVLQENLNELCAPNPDIIAKRITNKIRNKGRLSEIIKNAK